MCWSTIRRRPRQELRVTQDQNPSQRVVTSQGSTPRSLSPSGAGDRDGHLDYIPPARPYLTPFEFTSIPTKIPYDNHPEGFWDFPERGGWVLDGQREHRKFPEELAETLNPVLAELDKKYRCRRRRIPESFVKNRPNDALRIKCFKEDGTRHSLHEEVAFLQAWLFFGVLAELKTITSVPTPTLHVEGTPDILSTAALDTVVPRWITALEAFDDDNRRQRRDQMLQVVLHVVSLQTCISTVRSHVEESSKLTYNECKVLLAIRILFRAILLTLALSSPQSESDLHLLMQPTLSQSFPADWDELRDFATQEMLATGWCKSECQHLEQYDGAYNFFATKLTSGRWRMDHSRCNDTLCGADFVDEEEYTTKHVVEGCRCEWIKVKPEELCMVLDRGQIPRIVISKGMEPIVVADQPYVAISHVWAHGLGNPHENALPRCQMERLATYVSGLQVAGEPTLSLWMDTLCIPVQPDFKSYRKKAIKLMTRTYQNAKSVLVLDRELQRLDTESTSLLEQDLITAFIGWTRRLWTLQEGALAGRLYMQTLRCPHQLVTTADEQRVDLLAKICFREDIAALTRRQTPHMATLRQSVFEVSPPTSGFPIMITTTVLQRLANAVQHRSTSKMEDEALILAITLGLDVDPIIDAPNVDTRMAALLILLQDVPADIIFGTWPKLAHAPFRWAPRSLLGFPLQALQSFGPAAKCNSYGLHATYEGFLVDKDARPISTSEDIFVLDKASKMKYRFQYRGDATFPEICALIFRAYGIGGDTAIAHILRRWREDGEDVIEIVVVGYLVMIGSGVGLDVMGQPLLEGILTPTDQRWCVT